MHLGFGVNVHKSNMNRESMTAAVKRLVEDRRYTSWLVEMKLTISFQSQRSSASFEINGRDEARIVRDTVGQMDRICRRASVRSSSLFISTMFHSHISENLTTLFPTVPNWMCSCITQSMLSPFSLSYLSQLSSWSVCSLDTVSESVEARHLRNKQMRRRNDNKFLSVVCYKIYNNRDRWLLPCSDD